MHPDVFVLFRQSMNATRPAGIYPSAIQTDALGAAARAVVIVGDMDQVGHCTTGLLHGFTMGQLLRALARINDAGNDFQSPGADTIALGIRENAHAELLHHDHLVAIGVIKQHAGRRVAGEELTLELLTPAPGKQPMGETDGVDAEETTIPR